ncbi:zinc transport system substrate-binding protein [Bacillus ectoiniformans]|uniref:metal ABC transporter substrate-binding protein n=1 Tax=Bacillus ectoiniformans TaxID=1494429 RepID=UPI00195D1E8C|nr:metal ABC transporter substrate-binding protein [Bacillus ectoiniformans]MBM7647364.1 zinc transport system substrate-binding protein [Bacillus ectoiniformans]
MKSFIYLCISMIIFSLVLSGCGTGENKQESEEKSEDKKIQVYATIFPLKDFTEKIGGKHVEVKSVYPANVDAHSYEPTLKELKSMADADMFIYNGAGFEGFSDKVSEMLKSEDVTVVKATEGMDLGHENEAAHSEEEHGHEEEAHSEEQHHDHGDTDPHVWIDPVLSIELAHTIKDALVKEDPAHKETYEENYKKVEAELKKVDQEFAKIVNESKQKHVLVSHAAYGYWEERYGIKQIAIAGLSPTQEPSQKQLKEIIEQSKKHDVKYILFEQNVSSTVADIIQTEIGAKPLSLHNLESVTKEDINNKEDYFSIMRKNIQAIKTALSGK